jgi:hypothetical protein
MPRMPRRKTFRKRRQKKIQKGGASIQREITLPNQEVIKLKDFDDEQSTNYYGMIRKTRKNGMAPSKPEYEINSYIVSEDQKNDILKTEETLYYENDAFKQFYESEIDSNDVVEARVAFFKLDSTSSPTTLKNLELKNVNDVDWDKST